MAYLLHYKMRFEQNNGTEEEPNIVEYFQPAFVRATDADYDIQMAFAKAEAYNGEVTEEEVEDEPHATTQADQIAELQAQLKAQQAVIDALLGEESKEEST